MESTDKNILSRIWRTVEQGLGHFFITSSSFHFFDETNLGQYLFKNKYMTVDKPALK